MDKYRNIIIMNITSKIAEYKIRLAQFQLPHEVTRNNVLQH